MSELITRRTFKAAGTAMAAAAAGGMLAGCGNRADALLKFPPSLLLARKAILLLIPVI